MPPATPAELLSMFEAAFAAVPPVRGDAVSRCTRPVCAECDGLRADFGGHSWRSLSPEVVDAHVPCELPLLSPVAFHSFLPAFVRRAIERLVSAEGWATADPEHQDTDALDDVLWNLSEIEPAYLSQFAPAEREAVCELLRWVWTHMRLAESAAMARKAAAIFCT